MLETQQLPQEAYVSPAQAPNTITAVARYDIILPAIIRLLTQLKLKSSNEILITQALPYSPTAQSGLDSPQPLLLEQPITHQILVTTPASLNTVQYSSKYQPIYDYRQSPGREIKSVY